MSQLRRRPSITVQPRVCGERAGRTHAKATADGSAPRVRGTGSDIAAGDYRRRFSPACAGNGSWIASHPSANTVQPRVCGERVDKERCMFKYHGSAPRVRGTGLNATRTRRRPRFSPACAGNGYFLRAICRLPPVQPRVCGERIASGARCTGGYGSAPRVRGTAARGELADFDGRFSPACAGNGVCVHSLQSNATVQPRVCGERCDVSRAHAGGAGSAPRVRGTETKQRPTVLQKRFSPACAGNGTFILATTSASTVQPRVCGERSGSKLSLSTIDGSAPRVRGTDFALSH